MPVFLVVTDAVSSGVPEHPLDKLADTIAVMDTMDTIREQLAAVQ